MTLNQVNYLNIGLMLLCLLGAFIAPFEMFLISYAFLSPLHYFTQIAWMHKKKYFVPGKFDWVFLVFFAAYLVAARFLIVSLDFTLSSALAMVFFFSLIMVLFRGWKRLLPLFLVFLFVGLFSGERWFFVLFAVMMTTIVHTFVFTGSFILSGALKNKSRSSFLSLLVFILCVLTCFLIVPSEGFGELNQYIIESYRPFWVVNSELMRLFLIPFEGLSDLYQSPGAKMVMRFVAFVYAYHFANWFSKTKVIGWIDPAKKYGKIVISGWLICVLTFLYDYMTGITLIYVFSMLHVILEFPLNHQTFLAIGRDSVKLLKKN